MIVGVPKEIKHQENRVAISPSGVEAFVQAGHTVLIEQGAGQASDFSDDLWRACGARVLVQAADVWEQADMILKVKEPLPAEFQFLREGLILFTYLHLAAESELTDALLASRTTALAYETIQAAGGSLPLLTPMSEVAGRMAVQVGSRFLERSHGGRGVLLGGVPGVLPGRVVIVGGGVVGTNAARMALGIGAEVTLLDIDANRLRQLEMVHHGRFRTMMSNSYNLAEMVAKADLLIGAVLVPGRRAPRLVTEDMVKHMLPGSVVVDVAIDQGGSVETVDRVTTHRDPVYEKHGVLHYAVANMPGAVPRTSTIALTNVTIPYALQIAHHGLFRAVLQNKELARGVNTHQGHVTCAPVAESVERAYQPLDHFFS